MPSEAPDQSAANAATQAAIATPPAAAQPTAPQAPPQEQSYQRAGELPPDALKARLAEERSKGQRSALEALGVTDLAQAKTALDAWRAAEAAKQTDAERATRAAIEAERMTTENQALRAALEIAKSAEAAKLTEAQRAAVDAVAGNDLTAWFRTLGAMAPTWSIQAPAAPLPAAPVPPTPPASTSAAQPAPGGKDAPAQADPRTAYAHLKDVHPFRAARMTLENPRLAQK